MVYIYYFQTAITAISYIIIVSISAATVRGVEGGGDAGLVFVSSKTCIRTGFYPFRILAKLILRIGVVRVQKWPKIRFFTGKAGFLWFEDPKSQNKFC